MIRVGQLVNVSITENTPHDGKRFWNIAVDANAPLFLLADELAKEGAVRELQSSLRSVIKCAVSDYITSGREFIKMAAKEGKKKVEGK